MVSVTVERFVAGGDALGRGDDGRVVFVRGAVPGETVEVDVIDDKVDWSRAVTTRVTVASPDRVVPQCAQRRAGCGGCDWQHVAVPAQLDAKVTVVVDALRRTGRLSAPAVAAGRAVADRGYRTTIRVVGGPDSTASYRHERSHDAVAAIGCIVAHPRLVELLDDITITPGLDVTLRTSVATGRSVASWDARAGTVRGLPADVATGPAATIVESVAGHRLVVSAASFFQSGQAAAELLVDAVRRLAPELDRARHVLDAYAGVGLFAVAAAPSATSVVAVESSRSSVADARINLAGRNARIERCEFGRWRPRHDDRFDVAIADPARPGLGKPGVGALVGSEAPVLVLVSCDPASLGRDTALLAARGYRHDRTEVLDLFPHTHHVEAVSRFERSR